MSWLTTMVYYLNDGDEDFSGGCTSFLRKPDRKSKSSSLVAEVSVVPKLGRVLVFDHDVWHTGDEVTDGVKLCVRTDVMYGKGQSFPV